MGAVRCQLHWTSDSAFGTYMSSDVELTTQPSPLRPTPAPCPLLRTPTSGLL